ncbi:hypothetical protein QBC47DRAFT_378222 [Echria macrotheca]|uniref:Azaphilone pigments biosynthesis cluster protein L N-terminal domain-containing protein n=1 Tax=Echria macrotheca TaxID=438768 RepID=A0AAJ0BEV4_9PEZI|nr:hypothetical protein QBC47DRAFT_378222 [Echria macrotheca]
MDPLSIVAGSFGLAGTIAKVSVIIAEFSRDARHATADLESLSKELQGLSSVLTSLATSIAGTAATNVLPTLVIQVNITLTGCHAVVEQIEEKIQKYRRDKIFSKAAWAMFGQTETNKLRTSLEYYNTALNLGIHAISLSVNQSVKQDTSVILNDTTAIRLNTEEILARVNSIRQTAAGPRVHISHSRVEQWVEEMAELSSYAESTYQGTVYAATEVDYHHDLLMHPVLEPDDNPATSELQEPVSFPGEDVPNSAVVVGPDKSDAELHRRHNAHSAFPSQNPTRNLVIGAPTARKADKMEIIAGKTHERSHQFPNTDGETFSYTDPLGHVRRNVPVHFNGFIKPDGTDGVVESLKYPMILRRRVEEAPLQTEGTRESQQSGTSSFSAHSPSLSANSSKGPSREASKLFNSIPSPQPDVEIESGKRGRHQQDPTDATSSRDKSLGQSQGLNILGAQFLLQHEEFQAAMAMSAV